MQAQLSSTLLYYVGEGLGLKGSAGYHGVCEAM